MFFYLLDHNVDLMTCVIFVHLIDEDKDAKQETILKIKIKLLFFFIRQTFSQTCRFIVLILLFSFTTNIYAQMINCVVFHSKKIQIRKKKHVLREMGKTTMNHTLKLKNVISVKDET